MPQPLVLKSKHVKNIYNHVFSLQPGTTTLHTVTHTPQKKKNQQTNPKKNPNPKPTTKLIQYFLYADKGIAAEA